MGLRAGGSGSMSPNALLALATGARSRAGWLARQARLARRDGDDTMAAVWQRDAERAMTYAAQLRDEYERAAIALGTVA